MSNVIFELNYSGVGELLKSEEMSNIVLEHAQEVAARAGDGYEASVHETDQRVIANVYADTPEAKKDNLENNTLLKALF